MIIDRNKVFEYAIKPIKAYINKENQIWSVKPDATIFEALKIMSEKEWECIVRSKSSNELTAVFVKYDEDFLNQIFVVTLNEKEMVLAEVNGDLAEVVEIAIREKGFNVERVDS